MTGTILKLKAYLLKTLGIKISPHPWEGSNRLPLYLREHYEFYEVNLLGTSGLLMIDVNGESELTPATISKHAEYIRTRYGFEPVYVHSAITPHNRQRLIQQKVSFVAPGKQLYLPILGIDLREHVGRLRQKKRVLSPAAHVLLLHVLWQKTSGTLTPTKTASDLGYSAMTMTRVFDELEATGIGEHYTRGKERHLFLADTGKRLWEQALPHLDSPVKKRTYVAEPICPRQRVLAGQSALARYTKLVEPTVPVFAISSDDWVVQKQKHPLDELAGPEPGAYGIEIWNYSPARFTQTRIADRLSLYLSMKDDPDERVQAALDELLREMEW